MKTLCRMLSAALCLVLIVGTFSGCPTNKKEEVKIQTERKNVKLTIAKTDIDFLNNGASSYVIVRPANATQNEQFAASELQHFIQEASGATLNIIDETDNMPQGKYLFVGATKAAGAAGIAPAYEQVKDNGFVIKVVGDDCYLRGYTDIGTRNSIYEFFYYAFDYECYAADEIYLTPTKTAKMLNYNLTVNPSFDWRESNYGWIIRNSTNNARMRFDSANDIFVLGYDCHDSFKIISPTVYNYKSDQYKDWFASTLWNGVTGTTEEPVQLNYTNDDMRKEYTKNLINMIKDSPAPYMMVGMEDNADWSTDPKSTALKEKYGTDAAVVIQFINKVQADVDAWFAANRPGVQPTKLVMFAYYATVNPPAKYDSKTGKWAPIDDSVVLNDNSAVYFAPIGASYSIPFTSTKIDDVSSPYGQTLGWAACSKNLFAWTYALLPASGLVYYDTLEAMQQNYKLLFDNGTVMLLDETEHYQVNTNSGWSQLKAYVMSKLQWNNSLNMDELVDDFFDNYFGEASDTMHSLFDQEREWDTHIYNDLGAKGNCQENLVSNKYWSYNQLKSYLAQINQAYTDIAPLQKTDPKRYAVLYDRILLESLQFRYLLLQLYPTEFSATDLREARTEFRYDFERLGLSTYAEGQDVNTLWKDWGVLNY